MPGPIRSYSANRPGRYRIPRVLRHAVEPERSREGGHSLVIGEKGTSLAGREVLRGVEGEAGADRPAAKGPASMVVARAERVSRVLDDGHRRLCAEREQLLAHGNASEVDEHHCVEPLVEGGLQRAHRGVEGLGLDVQEHRDSAVVVRSEG